MLNSGKCSILPRVEAEPKSSVEAAHERQVPNELLQKLHLATVRFHAAKKVVDAAMDSTEMGHEATIERATEELRAAEHEVEQISLQIHGALKPPPVISRDH
jgi:hypothetical protein